MLQYRCNLLVLYVFDTVCCTVVTVLYTHVVALSQACSNLVGECYVFPPKEKLMEYRIMVTTLLTAGR